MHVDLPAHSYSHCQTPDDHGAADTLGRQGNFISLVSRGMQTQMFRHIQSCHFTNASPAQTMLKSLMNCMHDLPCVCVQTQRLTPLEMHSLHQCVICMAVTFAFDVSHISTSSGQINCKQNTAEPHTCQRCGHASTALTRVLRKPCVCTSQRCRAVRGAKVKRIGRMQISERWMSAGGRVTCSLPGHLPTTAP